MSKELEKGNQILYGNDFDENSVIKIKKVGKYIVIQANQEGMRDLSKLFLEFSKLKEDIEYHLHLDSSSPNSYGQLTEDSNNVVISLIKNK